MKQNLRERFLGLLVALFAAFFALLPLVAARSFFTGVSPLNRVVGLLAGMFDVPVLQDPRVQVLFMRFMLFLVFLAVSHYAFRKVFQEKGYGTKNKTAGVVAAAFSLIAAFLMPTSLVMANGGVITLVFSGLIPLGVIGLGLWFCIAKLDRGENANFATRLIAIVILFTLLAIIGVYQQVLAGYGGASYPLIFLLPARRLFGSRGEKR